MSLVALIRSLSPGAILARLKTVDGAGSGLDTDLVRGVQPSGLVANGTTVGLPLPGQPAPYVRPVNPAATLFRF